MFTEEQGTRDKEFVNRQVGKRSSEQRRQQNLWTGEVVEFVKALGPLGYFAAGVTHVEKEEAVVTPITSALVPVIAAPTARDMALTSPGGYLWLQGTLICNGSQTRHLPYSAVLCGHHTKLKRIHWQMTLEGTGCSGLIAFVKRKSP